MWMWESELTASADFSSEIKCLLSGQREMRTEMKVCWMRPEPLGGPAVFLQPPGPECWVCHLMFSIFSTQRSQPTVNTIHTSLWNGNTKPLCLMFTGIFFLFINPSRTSKSLSSFYFTISLAICLQDLNQTLILLLFWTTRFTLKFILFVLMAASSVPLSIGKLDSVQMLTDLIPGLDWYRGPQASTTLAFMGHFLPLLPYPTTTEPRAQVPWGIIWFNSQGMSHERASMCVSLVHVHT